MLEGNDSPSECRELVVVEPEILPPLPPCRVRRNAAFLTHLIATKEQVPQLRERRRAEPEEADAVYRAAMKRFSVQ